MNLSRSSSICSFIMLASLTFNSPVRAQNTNASQLDAIPRALEVRLALSAAPPHLRSEATVYILDSAKGYVLERRGSNDFTCFVERTDWVRADFRNDLFIPECFDEEGTKTIVPVSFDVARLRAEGKLSPRQLKEEITRRFKEGIYRSPGRPGISYMLSPIQRLYGGPESRDARTVNMPHYMFYAPNLTKNDVGGGPVMGQYPYLINPGPHAYMIVNVGETEKTRIGQEEHELLKDLCDFRSYFCKKTINEKDHNH